jgi:hypothetical protein
MSIQLEAVLISGVVAIIVAFLTVAAPFPSDGSNLSKTK